MDTHDGHRRHVQCGSGYVYACCGRHDLYLYLYSDRHGSVS